MWRYKSKVHELFARLQTQENRGCDQPSYFSVQNAGFCVLSDDGPLLVGGFHH
jgi:hypothetical protein